MEHGAGGINALIKEVQRAPLPTLPSEDTRSMQPRRQPSVNLVASLSQTPKLQNNEREISVVCKLPGLWCFVIAAQQGLKNYGSLTS